MASNNDFLPACPNACEIATEVAAASDNCITVAGIEPGEVTDIIFCEASPSDATLPTTPITTHTIVGLDADPTVNSAAILSWFGAIDNSAGGIVHFEVIGNKPAPETTTTVGPKKKVITTSRKDTLEISIFNKTNLNYKWFQKFECGWTGFIWYATEPFFYCGKNGMNVRVRATSAPLERGDGLSSFNIILEWTARTSPVRDAKPFI